MILYYLRVINIMMQTRLPTDWTTNIFKDNQYASFFGVYYYKLRLLRNSKGITPFSVSHTNICKLFSNIDFNYYNVNRKTPFSRGFSMIFLSAVKVYTIFLQYYIECISELSRLYRFLCTWHSVVNLTFALLVRCHYHIVGFLRF